MIDISSVLAGGAGALIVFGLLRGYSMWKRWSNNAKLNEEIDIDKLISDAIKAGNTELIAKLRKYFLTYSKPFNGLDHIIAEFLPDPFDSYRQRVVVHNIAADIPETRKQLIPGDDAAFILEQIRNDLPFQCSQGDFPIPAPDPVRRHVDADLSGSDHDRALVVSAERVLDRKSVV